LTGENALTLYIGVDFHPHQQTVSYCNNEEGEVHQASLRWSSFSAHKTLSAPYILISDCFSNFIWLK
jgi:hypothetical protein